MSGSESCQAGLGLDRDEAPLSLRINNILASPGF